jgi:hypothetical protein
LVDGLISGDGDQVAFSQSITLTAGDRVDFLVGAYGDFYGDSTGLQVTLTAVPEPTTIIAGALLLLPFGLHGLRHLRNRKQTA